MPKIDDLTRTPMRLDVQEVIEVQRSKLQVSGWKLYGLLDAIKRQNIVLPVAKWAKITGAIQDNDAYKNEPLLAELEQILNEEKPPNDWNEFLANIEIMIEEEARRAPPNDDYFSALNDLKSTIATWINQDPTNQEITNYLQTPAYRNFLPAHLNQIMNAVHESRHSNLLLNYVISIDDLTNGIKSLDNLIKDPTNLENLKKLDQFADKATAIPKLKKLLVTMGQAAGLAAIVAAFFTLGPVGKAGASVLFKCLFFPALTWSQSVINIFNGICVHVTLKAIWNKIYDDIYRAKRDELYETIDYIEKSDEAIVPTAVDDDASVNLLEGKPDKYANISPKMKSLLPKVKELLVMIQSIKMTGDRTTTIPIPMSQEKLGEIIMNLQKTPWEFLKYTTIAGKTYTLTQLQDFQTSGKDPVLIEGAPMTARELIKGVKIIDEALLNPNAENLTKIKNLEAEMRQQYSLLDMKTDVIDALKTRPILTPSVPATVRQK